MKLYAIRSNFKGTEIFEVNVIKETNKSFKIEDSRIYRNIINHADLYTEIYYHMFGTDKKLLIDTWNKKIDLKISECEEEIDRLKDMFLEYEEAMSKCVICGYNNKNCSCVPIDEEKAMNSF